MARYFKMSSEELHESKYWASKITKNFSHVMQPLKTGRDNTHVPITTTVCIIYTALEHDDTENNTEDRRTQSLELGIFFSCLLVTVLKISKR